MVAMKNMFLTLITLSLLMGGCSLFNTKTPPTKDEAIRISLHTLNSTWVEIRTYTMQQYLQDQITEDKLNEFKTLDDSFTLYYNLAVNIFLANQPNSDQDLESAINTLKVLVLNARKQVYSNNEKEVK